VPLRISVFKTHGLHSDEYCFIDVNVCRHMPSCLENESDHDVV
jgi:hypothetical protein